MKLKIKAFVAFAAVFCICFRLSALEPLIIYRPSNTDPMDIVRCYLKVYDTEGNDVTDTACAASYEWVSNRGTLIPYEKSFYLAGGMAMHIGFKPGKYKITFTTPVEKQNGYVLPLRDADQKIHEWQSNDYFLDTELHPKVIFVYPTANANGFYNGGWRISNRDGGFFKYAKPYGSF